MKKDLDLTTNLTNQEINNLYSNYNGLKFKKLLIIWEQNNNKYSQFRETYIIEKNYIFYKRQFKYNFQDKYIDCEYWESKINRKEFEHNFYSQCNNFFENKDDSKVVDSKNKIKIKLIFVDKNIYNLETYGDLNKIGYEILASSILHLLPKNVKKPYFIDETPINNISNNILFFKDIEKNRIIRKCPDKENLEMISKFHPVWTDKIFDYDFNEEFYYGKRPRRLIPLTIEEVYQFFLRWSIPWYYMESSDNKWHYSCSNDGALIRLIDLNSNIIEQIITSKDNVFKPITHKDYTNKRYGKLDAFISEEEALDYFIYNIGGKEKEFYSYLDYFDMEIIRKYESFNWKASDATWLDEDKNKVDIIYEEKEKWLKSLSIYELSDIIQFLNIGRMNMGKYYTKEKIKKYIYEKIL